MQRVTCSIYTILFKNQFFASGTYAVLDSHPSSFLMFIYMYAVTQTFIEQVIANMAQYIFFYNFRQFIEARIRLI